MSPVRVQFTYELVRLADAATLATGAGPATLDVARPAGSRSIRTLSYEALVTGRGLIG